MPEIFSFPRYFFLPQRGCVNQPRVAACPLPWVTKNNDPFNPKGVASGDGMAGLWGNDATPLGLEIVRGDCSQGSGVAATLDYGTESRWDSVTMSGKIDVSELDIQFPPCMKEAEAMADA